MKLYCIQTLPLASNAAPVFLNGTLGAFDAAQVGRSLERQIERAARTEACGFDGLVLHERHAAAESALVSAALLAATLVQSTSRLRLLLHALPLALKDPHLWAEELAWLDLASGGRVEASFAVGEGPAWWAAPSVPAHARARFSEALSLLERARNETLPLRHEGEHFSYKFYAPTLLPLQSRMPLALALALAGNDAFTRAEAARVAWPCLALEAPLPAQVALCRDQAGKAQSAWLGAHVHVGTGDELEAARQSLAQLQAGRQALAPQWAAPPGLIEPSEYAALLAPPERQLLPVVTGSADEVAAELARWADEAGASHLALAFDWPGLPEPMADESMQRFAEQVAPRLRS